MIPNLMLMSTFSLVTLIICGVLLVLIVVLFFVGKKMDKQQKEQESIMEANKQTLTMFIVGKKRCKFKDAGFPQSVVAQAPKMTKFMKVPVVKAKVGPQFVLFIADDAIYDMIPENREVKAVVSGLYIKQVKATHGKLEQPPKKKKNFIKRGVEKLQEKAGAKPIK